MLPLPFHSPLVLLGPPSARPVLFSTRSATHTRQGSLQYLHRQVRRPNPSTQCWTTSGLSSPLVQLAHDTASNSAMQKSCTFVMFGRRAMSPVGVILGVRIHPSSQGRHEFVRHNVESLQPAYYLRRRNSQEHTNERAASTSHSRTQMW